jgi:hypothetical protein
MCDRLPSKNRHGLAADVPQRALDVSARRQRLTVDDLRRLAQACRDLDDPVVMAKAWDDPHDTRGGVRAADSTHKTAPTIKHPRRFGQPPNLAVPDTVDNIHTLTRKSMRGKATKPPSLSVYHHAARWPNVTVTKTQAAPGDIAVPCAAPQANPSQ